MTKVGFFGVQTGQDLHRHEHGFPGDFLRTSLFLWSSAPSPYAGGSGSAELRFSGIPYRSARRSLNALLTTETELKLIAAAAMTGLSRMPKNG
jgi:hypothetical protein